MFLKISCTSLRMSSCCSIWSHSSKMKCSGQGQTGGGGGDGTLRQAAWGRRKLPPVAPPRLSSGAKARHGIVCGVRTDPLGIKLLFADELKHPARGADDDVRALGLEDALVLGHRHAAVKDLGLGIRQVAREAFKLVADLEGELTRVAEYLREDASNLKEFPGSSCTPCGVARVTAPLIARSERV